MILRKPAVWCYVILWIIYFQSPEDHTTATNSYCTCCKPTVTYWKDNYCLNISCHNDSYVLVHLNITSGNSIVACKEEDQNYCYGPTPELVVVRNSCYWRSDCSVPYPQDKLFPQDRLTSSSNLMDPFKCVFEEPDFLRVYSARCALKNQIYDIKEKKKKQMNEKKGTKEQKCGEKNNVINLSKDCHQGIIRSHPTFPWAYKKSMFIYSNEYNIVLRLRRKYMRNKVLLVGVRVLDICETETLTFMSDGIPIDPITAINNNCTWEFVVKKGRKKAVTNANCNGIHQLKKKLEIRFSGSNRTKGCEGFLVCFIVYKKKEKPPSKIDVCDVVAGNIPSISERGMYTDLCEENRHEEKLMKQYCCCPGVSHARCEKARKVYKEFDKIFGEKKQKRN